jgi:hypothetical protein
VIYLPIAKNTYSFIIDLVRFLLNSWGLIMKSKIIFSLAILSCISTFVSAQNHALKPIKSIAKTVTLHGEELEVLKIHNDTSEVVYFITEESTFAINPKSIHKFDIITCDSINNEKEITFFLDNPRYAQCIKLVVPIKEIDLSKKNPKDIITIGKKRILIKGELKKHTTHLFINELFKEVQ